MAGVHTVHKVFGIGGYGCGAGIGYVIQRDGYSICAESGGRGTVSFVGTNISQLSAAVGTMSDAVEQASGSTVRCGEAMSFAAHKDSDRSMVVVSVTDGNGDIVFSERDIPSRVLRALGEMLSSACQDSGEELSKPPEGFNVLSENLVSGRRRLIA